MRLRKGLGSRLKMEVRKKELLKTTNFRISGLRTWMADDAIH